MTKIFQLRSSVEDYINNPLTAAQYQEIQRKVAGKLWLKRYCLVALLGAPILYFINSLYASGILTGEGMGADRFLQETLVFVGVSIVFAIPVCIAFSVLFRPASITIRLAIDDDIYENQYSQGHFLKSYTVIDPNLDGGGEYSTRLFNNIKRTGRPMMEFEYFMMLKLMKLEAEEQESSGATAIL